MRVLLIGTQLDFMTLLRRNIVASGRLKQELQLTFFCREEIIDLRDEALSNLLNQDICSSSDVEERWDKSRAYRSLPGHR